MNKICDRCGGPMRFVKLDTGKTLPIDPQPNKAGNVAVQQMGRHKWWGYVISRSKPLREGFQLHMPHHATCNPHKPRVAYADRTPALFETGPAA